MKTEEDVSSDADNNINHIGPAREVSYDGEEDEVWSLCSFWSVFPSVFVSSWSRAAQLAYGRDMPRGARQGFPAQTADAQWFMLAPKLIRLQGEGWSGWLGGCLCADWRGWIFRGLLGGAAGGPANDGMGSFTVRVRNHLLTTCWGPGTRGGHGRYRS